MLELISLFLKRFIESIQSLEDSAKKFNNEAWKKTRQEQRELLNKFNIDSSAMSDEEIEQEAKKTIKALRGY